MKKQKEYEFPEYGCKDYIYYDYFNDVLKIRYDAVYPIKTLCYDKDDYLFKDLTEDKIYLCYETRMDVNIDNIHLPHIKCFKTLFSVLIEDDRNISAWYPAHIFYPSTPTVERKYKLLYMTGYESEFNKILKKLI